MPDVHIILAAPNKKKIKPLLQSEGLVIGVDGGAKIAIEESITLDVALGDFDSVDEEEYLAIKKEVGLIYSFSSEKDDTDAELALLYVLDNVEANNIYFYNWHGGRVDHLQSILMIVLQERFYSIVPRIHFISENNVISHYL
ncbi:MAG: thiamine diphosphokinase, partial [Atopostipes sp.]|nr:thiamine diphosphokinase [Atopostipes sp.]